MAHKLAYLTIAALALITGPGTVMLAETVRHPAAGVDIVINGAPQRRYLHDGRW